MAEEIEDAQAQIAESRSNLSATADDLHDRLSPSAMVARQGKRISGQVASVRETIMGLPDAAIKGAGAAIGQVQDATGSAVDAAHNAPDVARSRAQGSPLAVGLVAFGAGLLLASVLPVTRTEEEVAPSVADSLSPAIDRAQDAAKALASDMKDSAQEAAHHVQAAGTDAAHDLAEQGRSAAQDVAEEGRSAVK